MEGPKGMTLSEKDHSASVWRRLTSGGTSAWDPCCFSDFMFKVKKLDRQGPQRTPHLRLVKLQCTRPDGTPVIPVCFHFPHRNYHMKGSTVKMTPLKISPYGPTESLLRQSVHNASETLHPVPTALPMASGNAAGEGKWLSFQWATPTLGEQRGCGTLLGASCPHFEKHLFPF